MAKYNIKIPILSKERYISRYSTPNDLFDQINSEFHFTLDVCADDSNHKCDRWFGFRNGYFVNGLDYKWKNEICWCNPPYKREEISKWVEKAFIESKINGATVVVLIPASTDTKWFWRYCIDQEIRLIKGRIKFKSDSQQYGAPFPSMIVVFRP